MCIRESYNSEENANAGGDTGRLFSADSLDQFLRETAFGGDGSLILSAAALGQTEQHNDQQYFMRLDFSDTLTDLDLGFTVAVEAVQANAPGFEVLDKTK